MNPIFTYFISMFVCTTLEYITSFLMEKIFNMRWWDYSKMPYNLNGRICLKNSLLFGIGGMVIVYMTQPVVGNIVGGLDNAWLATLAIVSAVILIVDLFFRRLLVIK